jgi:outer membrane protein OmpA-like peptidoglycan-associated protein
MKKRLAIVLLCLCGFLNLLNAEVFKYIHVKGDKFRIIAEVTEKIYINGKFSYNYEALNKITAEVMEVKKGAGYINAVFQTADRTYGDIGSYSLTEELGSAFWRDEQGRCRINPHYFRPIVRNIPIFPEQDIRPGFTWSAPAQELHDFRRPYGIDAPYIIPFTVHYTYLGDTEMDGKKISQFKIEYSFEQKVSGIKPVDPEDPFPVKIAAKVSQVYNWDNEIGNVHSYTDSFYEVYLLNTGDYYEFVGTSKGELFTAPHLDRKKTVEDINKAIEKNQLKDVTVEEGEKGVKLTLKNIQFQPDSFELLPSEKQKLQKIAQILKKYPNRDIEIDGHAAKIGSDELGMILSKNRAKAVGDYLLSIGATTADKMIIVGKGATEPIADNSTEAGRIKNRRVEITILEN